MPIKTLLINTPWFILEEAELGQNSTPLGLCYLAGALEQQGYEVRILNAEHTDKRYYYEWTKEVEAFDAFRKRDFRQHPVWKRITNEIRLYQPQVIGISVRTPAVASALYLCELIKHIDKDIATVLGGPHPTILPEEMLTSSYVDYVVRGEGEETLVELIQCIDQAYHPSSVKNLSYKVNAEIIHNSARPLLDIRSIVNPAKHLMLHLDMHDQDDFNPIMTSRGCPFDCIFCGSSNVWSRGVRYRKPKDVVLEIAEINDRFDTRFFSFDDDTFTLNKKHSMEISNTLIEHGLHKIPGFRWTCNTRPETLSIDLLERMKEAGCAAVAIGIESGNDGILKKLKKGYSVEQVRNAALLIKKSGMVLAGQFIIGLPFETESDMWDTARLADEIEADSVKLSVATPLPNTELYTLSKDMGYFTNGINWSEVMLHNDGILFNKKYSEDEKKRILREVITEFKRIENKTKDIKMDRIKYYENMYKSNPQETLSL